MRFLIVEDDQDASAYLAKALTEEGHLVDTAATGPDGLHLAQSVPYDVWILDRMLPELDGLELLRSMRRGGNLTPALILSALGEIDDKVEGLRAGGDDYLVKPFALAELTARLEVLARRTKLPLREKVVEAAGLTLEPESLTVKRGEESLGLQAQEVRLLEILMRNSGQVVTRTMLLEQVWDVHFSPQSNVVDTQICRLRNKLETIGCRKTLIETVRGAGYRLQSQES